MDTKRILALLIMVPCAYGMQSGVRQTSRAAIIDDLVNRIVEKCGERGVAERENIRTYVRQSCDHLEREYAQADRGDGPLILSCMVIAGMAAGGVVCPFYGDARGIPAGALIALWIWAARNPTRAEALWDQMCASCKELVDKERDWVMLDELLAANNTF